LAIAPAYPLAGQQALIHTQAELLAAPLQPSSPSWYTEGSARRKVNQVRVCPALGPSPRQPARCSLQERAAVLCWLVEARPFLL